MNTTIPSHTSDCLTPVTEINLKATRETCTLHIEEDGSRFLVRNKASYANSGMLSLKQ
jgi:hypothetical protein